MTKESYSFSLKIKKGISIPEIEVCTIQPKDTIYLMGICGTAMSSLALFLHKRSFKIIGSDQNIYPPISTLLESYNIPIHHYKKENISKKIKLVILGNVVKKINPEVEALEELKIPYISLPDFLEQVALSKKKNIIACGTHGKSTVTSLMTHVGKVAGVSPGCFVGGVSRDFSPSFFITDSDWFVIEGDEYDTAFFAKYPKFFHYNPFALILTGIEFDHLDIYKNIDEILSVFFKLIQKVPKEGVLVVHSENKWIDQITKHSKAPIITYGLKKGDYKISSLQFSDEKTKFIIQHQNKEYPCKLNVYGYHNALNALGVFALAHYLKWPQEKILNGLESFKGMERRLQKKVEVNDIILFDDFAHHPTAVEVTLRSLKDMYPTRRLFAVFEPRSFTSRTSLFQKKYVSSFKSSDFTFIFSPFNTSNIPENQRFSSELLVQDLNSSGNKTFLVKDQNDLVNKISDWIQEGDVLVLMSNGSPEKWIQALVKAFKNVKNM